MVKLLDFTSIADRACCIPVSHSQELCHRQFKSRLFSLLATAAVKSMVCSQTSLNFRVVDFAKAVKTSLEEVEPSLPAWGNDQLTGCLQTKPAKRFHSASQVAAMLEQCVLHVQSPDNQLPVALPKSRWPAMTIVVAMVGTARGIFAVE